MFEQWLLFFGRFHPVILHLPIGAIVAVAAIEFLPSKGVRKELQPAKSFLLAFSLVTAIIAILSGLSLELDGGYSADRIFWHKLLGIGMTVLLALSLFFNMRKKSSTETPNWAYRTTLSLTVLLLGAGAHQGGVMTHGSNYLTEYFPLGSRSETLVAEANLVNTPENVIGLDNHAGELVSTYCVECHNPDKKKGKLNLEELLDTNVNAHPHVWQDVLGMLKDREMPPRDKPEIPIPSEEAYKVAIAWLENALQPGQQEIPPANVIAHGFEPVLDEYCTSCHGADEPESDLNIEQLLAEPMEQNRESWEGIVRKMNARQMPPRGKKRPAPKLYAQVIAQMEASLDQIGKDTPNAGRTSTFRRLTRNEYENAIRDLLALDIDASKLLPRDEVSHGFDNITVTELTPTLLDRYISASRKIARLAVGNTLGHPDSEVIRTKPDLTQDKHLAGLPLGTRGGLSVDYHFPRSGTYEFEIKLMRDRNEHVEGMRGTHELLVMLNREPLKDFKVKNMKLQSEIDKHLRFRADIEAGKQRLGVTFVEQKVDILEGRRKPLESSFNHHRHPRRNPAIYQVSITGPFEDQGPGTTESRKKIFGPLLGAKTVSDDQVRSLINRIAGQAYRRPLGEKDLSQLMEFYHREAEVSGFEAGIETALSAILVNPNFLFRLEFDPADAPPGSVYAVSDIELASRLSFFLWSSIPDEELLSLAAAGKLNEQAVLTEQVHRMLKDPRSAALVENFANQWLYLRNVDSVIPDLRKFTDFDDNLRQAMRRETEMLFEHIMREDKSILELITADYTFLNERLAKHYQMPGIYGDNFRKVELGANSERGGLLRHASILSVTSYANRTSPVIRGAWILENLIGSPAPPAPPNVTNLEDVVISENVSIRERLAAHRENPSCAACHELMDPIGFALEEYNAVGIKRSLDNDLPVDTAGEVADGTLINGVEALEAYILKHPNNLAQTVVEKLLTYALGRGVKYYDMPTVRKITRKAEENQYTFSSLIVEIVNSRPFQMRTLL